VVISTITMEYSTITPDRISIKTLISLKTQKIKPIDGLTIPNITMPSHLASKKRVTEAGDTLSINIRHLFNSLTAENIAKVKEQLRAIVYAKAQSVEMLNEIAEEILQSFIVEEQNIKNYMHLLNAIWNASVLIARPGTADSSVGGNVSPTIGNYFLNKCKEMFFSCIDENNIRKLALMDPDNMEEFDTYNRERNKINNLIVTICCLYEQRNSTFIKLSAIQLYSVMKMILDIYKKNQEKMTQLGDPLGDKGCENEEEYEILNKMCTLCAEQLYIFMAKQGKDFIKDKTVVKDQTITDLINRFNKEVIPTLSEAYLISKCQSLRFE